MLLASKSETIGLGTLSSSQTVALTFSIVDWPPPGPRHAIIGDALALSAGQTGTYTFDASNEPDFTATAAYLTDGIEEGVELRTLPTGGGSGSTTYREGQWMGNPDLAGHQIDALKLVVMSLDITQTGGWTTVSGAIRWEIWGR